MEDRENPKEQAPEQPVQPVQPKEEPKKERKPLFKKKEGPGILGKIKAKIGQWRRTMEVARKPSKEEYSASAKVTGIGILLLGFIGFIIFMIYHMVA